MSFPFGMAGLRELYIQRIVDGVVFFVYAELL
jgi:TM2 domain-containing membrane protein YozV